MALGRVTDNERLPGLVNLPIKVDLCAAGASHSVAANSQTGQVFFWGSYRSEVRGRFYGPIDAPQLVGEKELKKKTIQKLLSGENHAMILADKKVYVWGDPETGCLGRKPTSRRKFDQCLRVEALRFKNVLDIYTGSNHCFCKCEKKGELTYYAWGLNNWGQLGLGYQLEDLCLGEEVTFLKGKHVKDIQGGSHHTIFLMEDGTVWACGKNDDGQLGIGQ
jgi:regulator of chromosome condensation